MNDYRFGNFIYERRTMAGLSQQQMAGLLKVSDKTVSKWENGKAKPRPDVLKKIAVLFDVSVEDLLQMKKENTTPDIIKIVITGGPCAGKTTGMSWIQNEFSKLGYTVLFIPETATELINGGVAPFSCSSNVEFQKCQMRLQVEKERVFEQAARTMNNDKILIVCDRGLMDNRAYMDDLEFSELCRELKTDAVSLRDGYDAVFHLVTAAKGAVEFYTTENNTARTETPEQAAMLDDKLISAWTGHPHLRVIDNSSDFEHKMINLITEIRSFLGEPEPFEIERKYLIEYPNLKWLESIDNCRKVDIIQTYLKSDDGDEIRVRQRGENGSFTYTRTVKRKVSDVKRLEMEKRLTKDEYLTLLMEADETKRPIRKTRYCLMENNQYFEIDIYPFWNNQAIVEIELKSEDEAIHFPKELKVVKEVTDDAAYKNAALAKI
ncbi:MAG: AAA family ATPase [Eubacterium sp.]|nr:AAA family ATPase [Eubacterium sp.]